MGEPAHLRDEGCCHFPIGILGQGWYLIVSIPDLCTLTYFQVVNSFFANFNRTRCMQLVTINIRHRIMRWSGLDLHYFLYRLR